MAKCSELWRGNNRANSELDAWMRRLGYEIQRLPVQASRQRTTRH